MMEPWRVAATCAVLALATYTFFHLSPWHGVLLTGMGSDGAAELALMKERGAITIAQDEESSVVHGTPGEAIKLGAAMYVLAPEQIAQLLKAWWKTKRPPDNYHMLFILLEVIWKSRST